MGFFSFNEKYYARKLDLYEQGACSEDDVYEAKQLLKVLDDLADEGYVALGEYLEEKLKCAARLKAFIARGGQRPFDVPRSRVAKYGASEMSQERLLEKLLLTPPEKGATLNEELLFDIADFCRDIGRDGDSAYVFLLRDCLLPYFWFAKGGGGGLYAYPIGRAFLRDLAGEDDFDDIIRLPIYTAAEEGIRDFAEFKEFFSCETAKTLLTRPKVKDALARLLDGIPYDKIVVVESGYCGTIPMLLSAIDGRVDLKMYTTAPFFFDVYKGRIFCKRYERLRSFETLQSQHALFAYSSFKDSKFFVRTTNDESVWRGAAAEIAFVSARA